MYYDYVFKHLFKDAFNTKQGAYIGLGHLNIKLSPMIYASQDYDNSAGKQYAKMIKTVNVQVVKEIKLYDY